MSVRVPKTIRDYPSFGVDLGISCDACGRTAVFKPSDVEAFFGVRNISTKIPLNTTVFTCKCGSRDLKPIAVEVGRRPSPADAYGRMLHPIYIIRPAKR